MAVKLSSKQLAQVAFLESLPPKLQRVGTIIDQMADLKADEALVRGLGRVLDEIKSHASQLGLGTLGATAGLMSSMVRRGGGLQMKVRGLRELLGSLKINLDGAMRQATTPERVPDGKEGTS
jgi:hypothetical protein